MSIKHPESVRMLKDVIKRMESNSADPRTIQALEIVLSDLKAAHERTHVQDVDLLDKTEVIKDKNKRHNSTIRGLYEITGRYNSPMCHMTFQEMYAMVSKLCRKLRKQ